MKLFFASVLAFVLTSCQASGGGADGGSSTPNTVNTVVATTLTAAEEACEIDELLQGNNVPSAIATVCQFVDDPKKVAAVEQLVSLLEARKAARTPKKDAGGK